MYLCAALLGIAMSAPAQSTIAYFNGPPFPITTDTNPTIDFDQDGKGDFAFGAVYLSAYADTNATLNTNVQSGAITGDFFITSLNSNNVLSTGGEAVMMSAGTLIGNVTPSNAVWSTSDGASLALLGIGFGNPPTYNWYGPLGAPPGEGFIGVRFHIQNELHYGWIHAILHTNSAAPASGPFILDWAYETRPNTPIPAGATPQAMSPSVEWHFLGNPLSPLPPLPIPTSLALSPATPTLTDTINFVAPADGSVYLNDLEAASLFGNPLISIDSTSRTVTVTFTPPTGGPVPQIVMPVSGVDGQFGPLAAGTWTFKVLTNTYTFTVAGPPLTITPAGSQIVLSWPIVGSNYVLQTTTDYASGSWSNITSGITTNAGGFIFTSAISNQPACFYRLKQQ